MWFPLPRSEHDADADGAEAVHASLERRVSRERSVDEWEHNHWDAKARRLGQDAKGVGVADAESPLVDRVVGGGGDDDGVRMWQRPAPTSSRLCVCASHRMTGERFEGIYVEEVERGGSSDDVRVPSTGVRLLNQPANCGGWTGSANDHVQHPGWRLAAQTATPVRRAKASTRLLTAVGAPVQVSLMSW